MPSFPPELSSERRATPLDAILAVTLTVLAWASAFPLLRIALAQMSPVPLAAARFAVAAVPIGAWLWWTRPQLPTWRHAIRFSFCGLFGIALAHASLNIGQQSISAGAASFIASTIPVFSAILAQVALRDRLPLLGWAGTAISIMGVALIATGQPGGLAFGSGSVFVLATAIFTAFYFTIQKPLVAVYGALPCAAYTLLAGACLLAPWLPIAQAQLLNAPFKTGLCVLALGFIPSALGYATWTFTLGRFGAARASNFLYLLPPTAMALAYLLTGETPSLSTLAGGLVSVLGVIVVNWRVRTARIR